MRLLKKPFKPKTLPLARPGLTLGGHVPEEWKPFLPALVLSAREVNENGIILLGHANTRARSA